MTGAAERLLTHLRGREAAMTELLHQLVEVESPSSEGHTQEAAFTRLTEALDSRGMRCRRIRGDNSGGQLLAMPAERRRGLPCQLMIGHIDTVWPVGTLDGMPLVNDGERIRGPGVYDMKAGLVQIVFALEALLACDIPLPVTPVVFVNSDEEIGSHESTRQIVRLARVASRAFVLEPSLGRDGRIKTRRKGVGRYRIRVRGRAAHAGLDPESGASAILELSHQIQKLFQLNDPQRGISVNVGMIDGGLRPNVIAPESSAVVDVRVPDQASAETVDRAIHALQAVTPGVSLAIEGRFGRPPMEPDEAGRALWQAARKVGAELGLELQEGTAGGGSDGNTTSQYTPTLDGLGAVGDGAHAEHEFIFVDHLAERAALLAGLLMLPAAVTDRGQQACNPSSASP